MARPKSSAPPKKELRIFYSPEHYNRLQRQADLLDMTTAAFVRMVSMEKVTLLEAAGSQRGIFDMFKDAVAAEKMEEQRK